MDELPPKAAALLAAARRAHEPTSVDGARVRAAVQASLALPLGQDLATKTGAPGVSASVAPSALVPLAGKVVVLLSLLGGALWWIGAPTQRPTPAASALGSRASTPTQVSPAPRIPATEPDTNTPVPHAAEPQRTALTSALEGQPRTSETSAASPAPALRGDERAAPAPASAQRDPSQRQHTRHAALTARPGTAPLAARETPAAETATPVSELAASAERAQRDRASAHSKPSAAPESRPTAAARELHPAAPAPPSAREEIALMRTALGRLNAGDAAGALQLLDRHATQYESGVMTQERVGLRAIALCAAGQVAAGSAEQQRFLSMAARSPLAPRVRAACQGER